MNPFAGSPENLPSRISLLIGLALIAISLVVGIGAGGSSSPSAAGDALASKPTYSGPDFPKLDGENKGKILFTKGGLYPRSVYWDPRAGSTAEEPDMTKHTADSTALFGYVTNATDKYLFITGFTVRPTDSEKPADNLTFNLYKACSPKGAKLEDGSTCADPAITHSFYFLPNSHGVIRYGEQHYLIENIEGDQFTNPYQNYTLEFTGFTMDASEFDDNNLPQNVKLSDHPEAFDVLSEIAPITDLTLKDIPAGMIS